jgi:hypothetical protein
MHTFLAFMQTFRVGVCLKQTTKKRLKNFYTVDRLKQQTSTKAGN